MLPAASPTRLLLLFMSDIMVLFLGERERLQMCLGVCVLFRL
jgi:hypothetical protein